MFLVSPAPQLSRRCTIFDVRASRLLKKVCLLCAAILLASCGSGGSDGDNPSTSNPPIIDDGIAVDFNASRRILNEGDSTLLRWSAPDATSVDIVPGVGVAGPSGEREVSPAESTTYTLSAYNDTTLVARQTIEITVRPNADVLLQATITEGSSPLTVRFTPIVQSATAINRYYWDFEGDGGEVDGGLGAGANGFDRVRISSRLNDFDVVGQDISYTFESPGTYQTRTRVWDSEGNQKEAVIDITVTNGTPKVSLSSDVNRGEVPLRVSFSISAVDNDGISSILWDFDGDGTIDRETPNRSTSHLRAERFTYETPGVYQPVVTLLDSLGESYQFEPSHLAVDASGTPIQNFGVFVNPRTGSSALSVNHRISTSSFNGPTIVSYDWDFDGDGITDLSSAERSVDHVYTREGTTIGSVTAVTSDGTRTPNYFEIYVEGQIQFDISSAAFDPNSEATDITVTNTADTEFELVVVDSSNGPVATILPSALRVAGDYSASWDGTDTSGQTQAPGDYYLIVNSIIDGQVESIDQRLSSGGNLFYPSGWGVGRACSGSFTRECGTLVVSGNALEPFNNSPVAFDFSTPFNSRMSAYITLIGSEDFAATTFFRSKVMAGGETNLDWYGTMSDGRFLPIRTRRGYLPAIYGVTLSDNAIVLNHRTTLTDVSVTPNILNPIGRISSSGQSVIEFDLSRTADVTLSIENTAHGINVYRQEIREIPAGANRQLTWDGRDNLGNFVGPGSYAISLLAVDTFGQQTIPRKIMQQVEY